MSGRSEPTAHGPMTRRDPEVPQRPQVGPAVDRVRRHLVAPAVAGQEGDRPAPDPPDRDRAPTGGPYGVDGDHLGGVVQPAVEAGPADDRDLGRRPRHLLGRRVAGYDAAALEEPEPDDDPDPDDPDPDPDPEPRPRPRRPRPRRPRPDDPDPDPDPRPRRRRPTPRVATARRARIARRGSTSAPARRAGSSCGCRSCRTRCP